MATLQRGDDRNDNINDNDGFDFHQQRDQFEKAMIVFSGIGPHHVRVGDRTESSKSREVNDWMMVMMMM